MPRELKPDDDVVCALRHIREFDMDAEQIAYRYTVEHIDKMCAEVGLPPIEGEREAAKTIRLKAAISYHHQVPTITDNEVDVQTAIDATKVKTA